MDQSFSSPFEFNFIRRRASVKKQRMSLFQEDDCGFDEVCSPSMFTPVKYTKRTTTPVVKKDLTALFQDEDSGLGMETDMYEAPRRSLPEIPTFDGLKLKRPLFDDDNTDSAAKRQKIQETPKLKKSLSFGDKPVSPCDDIKQVVNRLVEEDDLLSDGSGHLRLPTVRGKHQDLKNISHDTVAAILDGKYDNVIGDFQIIDCRYPYEYEGGHIKGAENIYTHDGIIELLHRYGTSSEQRPVLIFHCEFSSERGPKLCRYLRSKDRELNSDNYPFLNFPEVYLLYGGYKEFYYNQEEHCDPMEYKPMLHGDHADDLRHFRSKSKSWTAGEKRRKRTQRLRF